MKYRDIIKPEMIEDYIRYHKKFYHEMENINSDILLLEKIYALPIADLQINSAWSLCALVADNTLQNLSVKLYRIFWDTDKDVFTLTKYKNRILKQYIKDEYKSWFQSQIKEVGINETYINTLKEKIHRMRNKFLAHRNKNFFEGITDSIQISFKELTDLVFKFNKLFSIMSFEVADKYTKNDYYDVDIRHSVEKAFSDNLDDCMIAMIFNSDLVNKKYNWIEYDISKLSNENKVLLDEFKKRAFSLNFISDELHKK